MVSWQWLVQPLHCTVRVVWLKAASSSGPSTVLFWPGLAVARPWSAAPKAPIRPAMSGRMTSTPISFSKARSTASL